jgi:hypothetical protein
MREFLGIFYGRVRLRDRKIALLPFHPPSPALMDATRILRLSSNAQRGALLTLSSCASSCLADDRALALGPRHDHHVAFVWRSAEALRFLQVLFRSECPMM